MLRAGAAQWFDALTAHSYSFGLPPQTAPQATPPCFRRLERLQEVLRSHNLQRPIWISEAGWLTRPDRAYPETPLVSEAQRAASMEQAEAMVGAQWPWVERLAWWQLGDGDGYSLSREGGDGWEPTLAWHALVPGLTPSCQAPAANAPPPANRPLAAADVAVRLGDVATLHPH
ncbi:MAG: hypothetical protein GX605_07280 [Chloroflexi bacterium]|nr:hypothetical protein [Chloroflexota bacterium]